MDENAVVRKNYHNLQNRLLNNDVNADVALNEATNLLDKVHRPQEAYLDSKVVFTCVRKLKEDADALRGTRSVFKTDEFAGLLKNVFDEEEGKFDWAKLGRRVQHCQKKPAPFEYVFGSLERSSPEDGIQGTATKPIKRRATINKAEAVPTKFSIQTGTSKEKNPVPKGPDVTELVKDVEKILRRACKQTQDGGVDLFKFVLHPTSFSETVRHLFLTSFLVKEKKAAIVIKDGEPYIFHGKSGGQLIFTLTKSQWEKLVEVLNITEPKIKLPE